MEITVSSNNVRNGIAAARKYLGLLRMHSREVQRTQLSHLRHLSILADGTRVVTELTVPWPRGRQTEITGERS